MREQLIPATPFKVSTETVIKLDPETPRERRLASDHDEARLLEAANPHLRAIIVAMLDTCCRPGELHSLQWKDVDLQQRALTIRAEKTKTRRGRVLPISSRLLSVLQMRRFDPAGAEFGPEAYVFGDEIGRPAKSIRTAWENARAGRARRLPSRRSPARGGLAVRGSRRADDLRLEVPRPRQPDHDNAVPERDDSRLAARG